MKDFLTTAGTGYPKSSAADVYAYIISELEDVIGKNVLQASTATKGGGRISQETAKAILAKTYLSADGTSTSRNTSPRLQLLPMR